MSETFLNYWTEKKDLSKKERFPWKKYIGQSLTQFCYEQYEKGLTVEKVYQAVIQILEIQGMSDERTQDLARNRVSAAYTEYNMVTHSDGGQKMANLKETAQAYTSQSTGNVADLPKVSTELQVQKRVGDYGEFDVITVEQREYRVPVSVFKQLKVIMTENPGLKNFKVKKSGEGMNTEYLVIPLD